MSPEFWIFLGVVVTTVGVIAGAYFAYKGQKYSKPTGNGFASEVKQALQDIKEHMARQDERLARIEMNQVEHLRDHALKRI